MYVLPSSETVGSRDGEIRHELKPLLAGHAPVGDEAVVCEGHHLPELDRVRVGGIGRLDPGADGDDVSQRSSAMRRLTGPQRDVHMLA